MDRPRPAKLLYPQGGIERPEVRMNKEDLSEKTTSASRHTRSFNLVLAMCTRGAAGRENRVGTVCPTGGRQVKASLQKEKVIQTAHNPPFRYRLQLQFL